MMNYREEVMRKSGEGTSKIFMGKQANYEVYHTQSGQRLRLFSAKCFIVNDHIVTFYNDDAEPIGFYDDRECYHKEV